MTDTLSTEVVAGYRHYPALITLEQAAEISQLSLDTLYDWSSRGILDAFKSKPGKRVLLARDGFVRFLIDPN